MKKLTDAEFIAECKKLLTGRTLKAVPMIDSALRRLEAAGRREKVVEDVIKAGDGLIEWMITAGGAKEDELVWRRAVARYRKATR